MRCTLCDLDPTGKCSFCRTMEEIQKYANNKKLDFGGSNFLIGNNSEQEYSSVNSKDVYSFLETLSSEGEFYSNKQGDSASSYSQNLPYSVLTAQSSGLAGKCNENYSSCTRGKQADYASVNNNYSKSYSEGAKCEK